MHDIYIYGLITVGKHRQLNLWFNRPSHFFKNSVA